MSKKSRQRRIDAEMKRNFCKINYKQSTKVVLFKNLKGRSHQRGPKKLDHIISTVFTPKVLTNSRYKNENGLRVFYSEPYLPIKEEEIDYELAAKYGVEWAELEDHFLHETITPYRIQIRNPGYLKRPDDAVRYGGIFYPYGIKRYGDL